MTLPTVYERSLGKVWFWAGRPFSLTAAAVPVLVGSALAVGSVRFDWTLFALALVGSVAIQVGTNLTDEYADHRRYGSSGKFLAPHKVIQRGELSERAVLLGMAVAFGFGVGAGLYIVSQTGWPILAVGLASVAAAYLYSAGPVPLGDVGLGEATVFFFMGPLMVMAAYFVQTEELSLTALGVSLPVALLVTAIMHCNNLRDVEEDRAQGKHSVATWTGVRVGRRLYAAMLGGAYVTVVVLAVSGTIPLLGLLGLLPLPWAVDAVRQLWRAGDRPAMNRLMVRTALLHLLSGGLLAMGLAIDGAI